MPRVQVSEETSRPGCCPFCQSSAVGTLAKAITSATYWRCHRCGEVWNVARLETAGRLRPPGAP